MGGAKIRDLSNIQTGSWPIGQVGVYRVCLRWSLALAFIAPEACLESIALAVDLEC